MLQSRAERIALGAAPDVAVVDVGLNFLKTYSTAESHEQKNDWPEHHLRTRSLFRFCTDEIFFLRPDQNLKLRIGSAL